LPAAFGAAGEIKIPRSALAAATAQARRLMATATVCASGAAGPPRGGSLEGLRRRMAAGGSFSATLAGARIVASDAGVLFQREPGEMRRRPPAAPALTPGRLGVWDGRFELAVETPCRILPLAGAASRLCKADRAALRALPASVRPSLPLLATVDALALPRPFGCGPGFARVLGPLRFAGAWGLIAHESDISHGAMA